MARQTIVATVKPGLTASAVDDVMSNAASAVTDAATLAAAITAAGITTAATPTLTGAQSTAIVNAMVLVTADVGKANSTADVVVSANVSTVNTVSILKGLLANIRQNFEATGQLTP